MNPTAHRFTRYYPAYATAIWLQFCVSGVNVGSKSQFSSQLFFPSERENTPGPSHTVTSGFCRVPFAQRRAQKRKNNSALPFVLLSRRKDRAGLCCRALPCSKRKLQVGATGPHWCRTRPDSNHLSQQRPTHRHPPSCYVNPEYQHNQQYIPIPPSPGFTATQNRATPNPNQYPTPLGSVPASLGTRGVGYLGR